MKLTEKSMEVFNYVKTNGGRVALKDMAEALGRGERSVGANVLDLTKKGLAVREKVAVEGGEAVHIVLTDEGMAFVPDAE